MDSTSASNAYPRIIRRIKGAQIDGFIMVIAAIATLVAADSWGVQDALIKITCVALIVLLLEPCAVAFTGGTIGHHLFGMRVRRKGTDKRLNVFAALLRFVIKTLFGLPSFLIALISPNRQALHDVVARSLVVYKSTTDLPDHEPLHEITRTDEQRTYLSVWRRLLVILLYWVLCYLCLNVFALVFLTACMSNHSCGATQLWSFIAALAATLIAVVAVTVLGWRGSLYGCRKQAVAVT